MWVFFAVLTVVILLGCIPIRFNVEYGENGFSACLRVLFLRLKFPNESEKAVSEKASEDKKIKEKKPGSMKTLTSIIKPASKTLGKSVRILSIRKLIIYLTIASGDAFSTAMVYGSTAAGIGAVFPFVDNNLKIKRKYISVNADFESSETKIYLFADISILVWQIFVLAIYFLYQYLKKMRITKMKEKGLEKHG